MQTPQLFQAEGAQAIPTQDLPESIAEMIQQQVARLTQEYSYILNCQVSATVPAFYQAGTYLIRLVLTLPDRDLTIEREPIPDYYQEDIYVAIWSAFDLARKKLQQHSLQSNYGLNTTPIQKVSFPQIPAIRRCIGYAKG